MKLGINRGSLLLCIIWLGCLRPARFSDVVRMFPDVLLRCPFEESSMAVSLDTVSVRWDRNGWKLVQYSAAGLSVSDPRVRLSLEELAKGNASVSLSRLSQEDSGIYTCAAQHANQRVLFQYNVTITALTAPGTPEDGFSDGSDPKIIQCNPGDHVMLNCSFQFPTLPGDLTIQWTKNGELKSIRNMTCLDDSDEYLCSGTESLDLSNVTPRDAALYNCFIRYGSLSVIRNFILQVSGDSFLSRLIQTLENHSVALCVVALDCVVAISLYIFYKP
ncbi:uncharacterized protein RCH25_038009 [Pelodytes ibericus]